MTAMDELRRFDPPPPLLFGRWVLGEVDLAGMEDPARAGPRLVPGYRYLTRTSEGT